YRIKKHRLARHVKFRIGENHSLEITTPVRFNQKNIPAILEENKQWIIRHLSKVTPKKLDSLPVNISLNALNEIWNIHYEECQAKFEMIERPTKEIVFVGKTQEKLVYRNKLIHWIKNQSRKYLAKELDYLSQQTNMDFD